jgi:hypothetical protein
MSWLNAEIRRIQKGALPTEVYGIIGYSDNHANIKKALRDNDYWMAFDAESGPQWAVLAVRARQGHYSYPSSSPGTLACMIPIWREPAANREILEELQIDSTSKFPALIVFAYGSDNIVVRSIVPLDDSSIEQSYLSIKKALETVRTALEHVYPQYLRTEGAYRAVENALSNAKEWERIRNGFRIFERIRGLFF